MPELLLRAPAVRWYSPASRLPARVRERIRTQEERSEILVGWIQLAFIVGMAVVYTIAPKKFSGDAPFAPVPWVLTAYFVFTLLRLGLAHARRLPRWFVYVVDRRRHGAAARADLQLPHPVPRSRRRSISSRRR